MHNKSSFLLEDTHLAWRDPNFDILASQSFPFFMPGNVGPAWYDTHTTVQNEGSFIMQQLQNVCGKSTLEAHNSSKVSGSQCQYCVQSPGLSSGFKKNCQWSLSSPQFGASWVVCDYHILEAKSEALEKEQWSRDRKIGTNCKFASLGYT